MSVNTAIRLYDVKRDMPVNVLVCFLFAVLLDVSVCAVHICRHTYMPTCMHACIHTSEDLITLV